MTLNAELSYDYANARLKAMTTRLIGRQDMLRLAQAGSLDDMVSFLERTEYRPQLVDLSISHRQADLIDRALDISLAKTYAKVLSIVPPDAIAIVRALAGKWDAHNIRTILLGKHLGHEKGKIEKLIVPAGGLERNLLTKLNAQDSVEDVVYFLGGTEYGETLVPLVKQYAKSGDINVLTSGLGRHYYRRLSASVGAGDGDWETIGRLVRFDIDSKNISSLMRYLKAGNRPFDLRESYIEGGRISLQTFIGLGEGDIRNAVSSLSEYADLTRPLKKYETDGSLVHFEVELEGRLYLMGLKAFRHSTLSVGSVVGYLYLRETEVGNLRRIARGMEFNVPKDRIQETLVVI